MKRTLQINILIVFSLLAAIIIPLFWLLWFTFPAAIQTIQPGSPEYPAYVTFEQAFLLADAWLALCSLLAAIGLFKMRFWGLLFALLAGSAAIFLGLMDLLYDLQHGVFSPLTGEAAIELTIVCLSLGLGAATIILAWNALRNFEAMLTHER